MERALTRRGEGRHLARLQDEMNDLFGRFFGGNNLFGLERTALWPTIDVAENENEIIVKAEVPGCKPEEIEISVQNQIMTIKGEKKESAEEKKDNYYHMESRYGSFRRDINLPAETSVDKIQAKCHDGVLTITMPKIEKAKAKQIKVQT